MGFRILFVDQGRATDDAAIGHVRVRHAIEAGVDGFGADVDDRHVIVRPFARPERLATRYAPHIGTWNVGALRWYLTRGWVARQEIRRELSAHRPDVIHLTTGQVSFLLGAMPRHIPAVLSFDVLATDWGRLKNGLGMDEPLPFHLRPVAALERQAIRRAPLNVAWTDTVAARLQALSPGARSVTLHPGLDTEAFRPPASRPEGRRPRVLFVGGRWEQKGGPELLEALRPELGRTVDLDVVTSASLPPMPGVTVHSGRPGSTGIAELFARADLFCLPTAVDAVPWVVLEAMASGVPVVASSVGSIPEMIGPDAGRTVAPGNVLGLRSALLDALDSPERRRAMGDAGRDRVERVYDAQRNIPRLIEHLRGIAGRELTPVHA